MTTSFFPSNIKYLRKSINYNQTDFAKIFEKVASSVSDYENGKTEPSFEVLMRLCNNFGLNLDLLILSDLPKFFSKKQILRKYEDIQQLKKEGKPTPNVSLNVSPNVSLNQKSHKNSGEVNQVQEDINVGNIQEHYTVYKKGKPTDDLIEKLKYMEGLMQEKNTKIEQLETTISNLNLLIEKLSKNN